MKQRGILLISRRQNLSVKRKLKIFILNILPKAVPTHCLVYILLYLVSLISAAASKNRVKLIKFYCRKGYPLTSVVGLGTHGAGVIVSVWNQTKQVYHMTFKAGGRIISKMCLGENLIHCP